MSHLVRASGAIFLFALACAPEDTGTGGTGGARTSGGSPSTGGTSTGGRATGGTQTGGKATGGRATGGTPTGGKATGGTSSSGCTPWPAAKGTQALTATRSISGTVDLGLVRYTGWGGSQDEGQDPLFKLSAGATLKNVIIGTPAGDGIHCEGACTLQNVWFEDVGEDAVTFRGSSSSIVSTVQCAGAKAASDKILQHNGAGTVIVKDFWAQDFGKVYRSCGNCSTQYARHVILSNITASSGKSCIAGINTNYGDTASFWNVTTGGVSICDRYTGNSTGAEPTKTGSGIDGKYCIQLTAAP